MAPAPEARRRSLNTATPLYAASTNRRCAARPVACRASISLAAIWSKQRPRISPTIGRWNGDKSLSFLPSRALRQSCFSWSIGSHRPRGLGQFTACCSWCWHPSLPVSLFFTWLAYGLSNFQVFCSNSGNFAIFAAIRLASSLVSNLPADRRPGSLS